MELLSAPLATAEFLAVDTETNGRAGDACELTEVGAVLVGGGELHDRWETLVGVRVPLSRSIQRFTGISQAMVDEAPASEASLPELAELMEGRVLVAHNASFDRRVLAQAFTRAGLQWPDPPTICTVALARRYAPLVRQRKLAALAAALGIDVEVTHRALADAETCARVFCALFGRLCAVAGTVGEALEAVRPARRRPAGATRRSGRTLGSGVRKQARPALEGLPESPGVYLFRNAAGQVVYVGKSVSLRSRARSHFADASRSEGWTEQAAIADHQPTNSELGALLLEHRLIRELKPPGNAVGKRHDGFLYLRCRLDIAFPVLEIAPQPAPGHAVTVGPLRGRALAVELKEQLDSLFELRHCGRKLQLRPWPSAYGQMGRCLSPCLNDLDPNVYRRRLDAALGLFCAGGDGGRALLDHLDAQIGEAAHAEQFERAAWLLRRRRRMGVLVDRLEGTLRATHLSPQLVVARHPSAGGADAFWLVGGRVADWGALPRDPAELSARTAAALRVHQPDRPAYLPPGAVAEARIVQTWLAAHEAPALALDPAPDPDTLQAFATRASTRAARRATTQA